VLRKNNFVFSTAPWNISVSTENYRRYDFQSFANISGKFTTLDPTTGPK